MVYQDLKKAIELFGLGERATLEQIKVRHRELVKNHHPDHRDESDPEIIRKINAAHEILCTYCKRYQYCFTEEEFLEQFPEERLRRQFGWDPAWCGQKEPEED
jgi:DnaJ-class molecular chaperone